MWDLQQPLPDAVKEGRGLPKSLCICRPLTDSGALFQENGRHSNYSLQEVDRPQTGRLQNRSALRVPRSTRLDMSSLPTPYSLGVNILCLECKLPARCWAHSFVLPFS